MTPKPPDGVARRKKRKKPKACTEAPPTPTTPQANDNGSATAPPAAPAPAPTALPAPPLPAPSASALHAVPILSDDPTVITVKHWSRILDGELFATSSRVEWAVLLRRTFGFDALRCPKCAAKMRLLATITEPATVHKILSHLGLPTEPPPRAPARDPTGQESFDFEAA